MKRYYSRLNGTLNEPRQEKWIACEKETVKSVLKKCVIVVKQNTKLLYGLPETPFPLYRDKIGFPFCSTGFDYLVSLFIKPILGNSSNVYICFAYIF